MRRAVGQREGVEACGDAGLEAVIATAQGQDRELEALVLVQNHMPDREALELRQQEGQQRRLAGAGHADDAGMPQVPHMGREPQRRVHRGAEEGHRFAPVVAVRGPRREGVEGAHGREVEAGDRRLARAVLGVARQGGVDLPFQGHVLAYDDIAGIGQRCMAEGHVARQGVQVLAVDDQGRVVVPHHEPVGDQLVHGLFEGGHLGHRGIPRRDQPPALGGEQIFGLVLVEEGEGLNPIQLVGLLHQSGEHLRVGLRQVLLDGQRRAEAAVARTADLEDLAAEQEAVAADGLTQVERSDRDPLGGVVEQQAVKLADFGEAVAGVRVDAEPARTIVGQGRAELCGDVFQLVDAGDQQVPHQALVGLLGKGDLGAQGRDPVHQDQPQPVLIEGPGLLEPGIGVAHALGEGVRIGAGQVRMDAAPREDGPQAQACRGAVAQRHVELLLVEIPLLRGLGLERGPRQLEGGHQGTVPDLGDPVRQVRLERHQDRRLALLAMDLQGVHGR